MQRLLAALLAALTVVVLVVGLLVWTTQRESNDRLDELLCLERAHVIAAIAVMVPDSRVDVDGRIDSVGSLGRTIDDC